MSDLVRATDNPDRVATMWVDAGYRAALRAPRGRSGWWSWETGDARGTLDTSAPGRWAWVGALRAEFLAGHSLADGLALLRRLASMWGDVIEVRTRRVDLAADVAGWTLGEGDARRIIARPRARIGAYEEHDGAGVPVVEHRSARAVTGWTVCPGGEVLARIYDKRAELCVPGREPKRAWEEAGWTARGWTDPDPVTRCEFQIRGEALDELDLRDPERLEDRIDPVWRYLVGRPGATSGAGSGWVRFADKVAERRGRSVASAAWEAVRSVRFVHDAAPAVRAKVARRGVTAGHAFGSLASILARIGRLDSGAGGFLAQAIDPAELVASMTEDDAAELLRAMLDRIGLEAARAIGGELRQDHGTRGALIRVARRSGAAVARVGRWQGSR